MNKDRTKSIWLYVKLATVKMYDSTLWYSIQILYQDLLGASYGTLLQKTLLYIDLWHEKQRHVYEKQIGSRHTHV